MYIGSNRQTTGHKLWSVEWWSTAHNKIPVKVIERGSITQLFRFLFYFCKYVSFELTKTIRLLNTILLCSDLAKKKPNQIRFYFLLRAPIRFLCFVLCFVALMKQHVTDVKIDLDENRNRSITVIFLWLSSNDILAFWLRINNSI